MEAQAESTPPIEEDWHDQEGLVQDIVKDVTEIVFTWRRDDELRTAVFTAAANWIWESVVGPVVQIDRLGNVPPVQSESCFDLRHSQPCKIDVHAVGAVTVRSRITTQKHHNFRSPVLKAPSLFSASTRITRALYQQVASRETVVEEKKNARDMIIVLPEEKVVVDEAEAQRRSKIEEILRKEEIKQRKLDTIYRNNQLRKKLQIACKVIGKIVKGASTPGEEIVPVAAMKKVREEFMNDDFYAPLIEPDEEYVAHDGNEVLVGRNAKVVSLRNIQSMVKETPKKKVIMPQLVKSNLDENEIDSDNLVSQFPSAHKELLQKKTRRDKTAHEDLDQQKEVYFLKGHSVEEIQSSILNSSSSLAQGVTVKHGEQVRRGPEWDREGTGSPGKRRSLTSHRISRSTRTPMSQPQLSNSNSRLNQSPTPENLRHQVPEFDDFPHFDNQQLAPLPKTAGRKGRVKKTLSRSRTPSCKYRVSRRILNPGDLHQKSVGSLSAYSLDTSSVYSSYSVSSEVPGYMTPKYVISPTKLPKVGYQREFQKPNKGIIRNASERLPKLC